MSPSKYLVKLQKVHWRWFPVPTPPLSGISESGRLLEAAPSETQQNEAAGMTGATRHCLIPRKSENLYRLRGMIFGFSEEGGDGQSARPKFLIGSKISSLSPKKSTEC
jgi:hypothetical protein